MKIVAIIQARMNSSRLPGKVMLKLGNDSVLTNVIQNVKKSNMINSIIVATSNSLVDDIIDKEAQKNLVETYRGSESNVLERYYHAAVQAGADVIVRITSDCPLIDSSLIDNTIRVFLDNDYGIVTNAGINEELRTYPRGLDVEVFGIDELEFAFRNAKKKYEIEHVTPFIYETFKSYVTKNDIDYSSIRITLDTLEDYRLLTEIYKYLYPNYISWIQIISIINEYPSLREINGNIRQKKLSD